MLSRCSTFSVDKLSKSVANIKDIDRHQSRSQNIKVGCKRQGRWQTSKSLTNIKIGDTRRTWWRTSDSVRNIKLDNKCQAICKPCRFLTSAVLHSYSLTPFLSLSACAGRPPRESKQRRSAWSKLCPWICFHTPNIVNCCFYSREIWLQWTRPSFTSGTTKQLHDLTFLELS